MRILCSLMMLLLVGTAMCTEPPVPKGVAPQIGLASAVQKDGKVMIEVLELREVMRIKMPNGGDVFIEERHWLVLTTGTLGDDIRAYRPDGKPATARDVLNALQKPRGTAYFLGYDKEKPVQPDQFYLSLFKEESIALAFDRPELAPPTIQP
ncbi:MAG: hypothetical protein JWP89_6153 [Schlesneria sp.]|nr:hypothetical protein [Schlesneria sp.]